MLYFKTKKNRLVIQYSVGEHSTTHEEQFIYFLIGEREDPRIRGYYEYVTEEVWKNFEKKSIPMNLEENPAEYERFNQALDDENECQQEMADQDWMMEKAVHEMWRRDAQNLLNNGITPLMVF